MLYGLRIASTTVFTITLRLPIILTIDAQALIVEHDVELAEARKVAESFRDQLKAQTDKLERQVDKGSTLVAPYPG